jgi:hypothetical protein
VRVEERAVLLTDDITALAGELLDVLSEDQRPWKCPACRAVKLARNADRAEEAC